VPTAGDPRDGDDVTAVDRRSTPPGRPPRPDRGVETRGRSRSPRRGAADHDDVIPVSRPLAPGADEVGCRDRPRARRGEARPASRRRCRA
jgi:hypothetical protein